MNAFSTLKTTTNDLFDTHHPLLRVFDASNINHERNKYHPLTIHRLLDSEGDFRTWRRNVNECHHQQLFSEMHQP